MNMQTFDEVKKHCWVVGEGIALREMAATLDQLYRTKLQERFG